MEKEPLSRSQEPEHFFLRMIHREWPVIRKAPWSIGAIVLMCVGISYFGMNFFYSRQLDTISEERDVANRENDKLYSRVLSLESRVPESSPSEWPPLTDQEVKEWTKTLASFRIDEIGVYWGNEVEALKFFRSLQKIGKSLNIPVFAGEGLLGPVKKTTISARNLEIAKSLCKLFNSVGIPATAERIDATEGAYVQIIISDRL